MTGLPLLGGIAGLVGYFAEFSWLFWIGAGFSAAKPFLITYKAQPGSAGLGTKVAVILGARASSPQTVLVAPLS